MAMVMGDVSWYIISEGVNDDIYLELTNLYLKIQSRSDRCSHYH